ncbi:putative polypeptide N-acetylgalactosaminyltransferase 9 [Chironomus tepperi]|uniref:putative polypeptide N-acetylgalactosaminyltransferase 9 n=1 Tax=Chironomus tepperi TaxID=113505 RepID=UPI00391FA2DA
MVFAIKNSFNQHVLQEENSFLKNSLHGFIENGFDKLKAIQDGIYNAGGDNKDEYQAYVNVEVENQIEQPEYELSDGITDEARRYMAELNLTNPGHLGAPVIIPPNVSNEIKQKIDDGFKAYGFNAFVSSLVSLNREIPDKRSEYCRTKVYRSDLPKVSVVIPVHEDDWSLLLRTIHSIIRYSNLSYIEEILISDDYSAREHLKTRLDDYVKKLPKVRIVRSERRLGIVANRVLGARNAIGPIIIFVDSHVEVTPGWLEPVLDQLKDNPNLVIWSKISGISDKDLRLNIDDGVGGIGAFDWAMNFKWIDVKWYEGDHPTDKYAPKASPTLMGPTYGLWKDFLERIGYFDVDMDIWGGEDVELGFRAWMCGGRVEMVPCSMVCHMFRGHTYSMASKGKGGYRWNTDRIAEVWLQDYKRYYYRLIGDTKDRQFGDITERLEIRNKCQSFQWYLDNVYPMYEVPENIRDTTTTQKPEIRVEEKEQ